MKKRGYLLLSLVFLIILASMTACSKAKNDFEKSEILMDTLISISYHGKEETMDKVFDIISDVENKMSRQMLDSEVHEINNNAGKSPVVVSDKTYYVIEKALEYSELTGGYFDPTIGPLIEIWDINESHMDRDWLPEVEDIEKAKSLVGFEKVQLLEDNTVYLEEEGMKLDLGSIAKGYAGDLASQIIREDKGDRGIINMGGDTYLLGNKANGDPWRVGIQNPDINTQDPSPIAVIETKGDRSIVTSGDYERFFELGGVRFHHIINPFSGLPGNNELTSVTVISDKSIDGDALATSLFLLGLEDGINFLENTIASDRVGAIFITKDKELIDVRKRTMEYSIDLKDGNYTMDLRVLKDE